jgi:riboflavin synthase
MFTGIITDVGRVGAVTRGDDAAARDTRLRIVTRFPMAEVALGASISCSGVCLTVVATGPDWFDVDASGETLSLTTLGGWEAGRAINLERALKVGDELGGHIVSGHVDGLARVVSITPEGGSTRWVFELPHAFARYVAAKGSIALDGVSLTVNTVEGARFGVNIIPHTLENTTFGALKAGDLVHFEVDMLARYVARLAEVGPA